MLRIYKIFLISLLFTNTAIGADMVNINFKIKVLVIYHMSTGLKEYRSSSLVTSITIVDKTTRR